MYWAPAPVFLAGIASMFLVLGGIDRYTRHKAGILARYYASREHRALDDPEEAMRSTSPISSVHGSPA